MRNRIPKVRGCELDPNTTTENQILRLAAYINQRVTTNQLKEEGATGTPTKRRLAMSSNVLQDILGEARIRLQYTSSSLSQPEFGKYFKILHQRLSFHSSRQEYSS